MWSYCSLLSQLLYLLVLGIAPDSTMALWRRLPRANMVMGHTSRRVWLWLTMALIWMHFDRQELSIFT